MAAIAEGVTGAELGQTGAVAAVEAAVEGIGLRSFTQAVGQDMVVSSVRPGTNIPVLVVQRGGRVVQGAADMAIEGTKVVISNVRY